MVGNKYNGIFVFNIDVDGLRFFAGISDCFSLYYCLGSVCFPYFLFYSVFLLFYSCYISCHLSFYLWFAISECTRFCNSLCCLLPSIFCWLRLFLLPSRCACLQILRANRQLVRVIYSWMHVFMGGLRKIHQHVFCCLKCCSYCC